jgi:hypothetical protein
MGLDQYVISIRPGPTPCCSGVVLVRILYQSVLPSLYWFVLIGDRIIFDGS